MEGMTLSAMAKACGGKLVGTDEGREAKGVVIDSRQVETDGIFVAVVGERVDGHTFIPQVIEQGAMGIVCEKEPEMPAGKVPYILVEDSLVALRQIAQYYRSQLTIPVVGITGSVGKTSAKEFVAAVLGVKGEVLKTEGNFNNEIGVPLTLLRIRKEHQMAVVEMGINHFGEMHRLSQMAQPDVCLFTNIGQCHLEFLGSRDGILKAKTEMFDYMKEDGFVCLNGDDDKLSTLKEVKGKKPITFGLSAEHDVYATQIESMGLFGTSMELHLKGEAYQVTIPLPGEHMVYNALAAAAVGSLLGLTGEEIVTGIEQVEAVPGRSHVIKGEKLTVIDDCYNANPVSMEAALTLLESVKGRKVAILGDMFELGEKEWEMHGHVGQVAAGKSIDLVLCVGERAKAIYEELEKQGKEAKHYDNKEALVEELPKWLQEGDTVLLKASHGMGFSDLVEWLRNK